MPAHDYLWALFRVCVCVCVCLHTTTCERYFVCVCVRVPAHDYLWALFRVCVCLWARAHTRLPVSVISICVCVCTRLPVSVILCLCVCVCVSGRPCPTSLLIDVGVEWSTELCNEQNIHASLQCCTIRPHLPLSSTTTVYGVARMIRAAFPCVRSWTELHMEWKIWVPDFVLNFKKLF